MVGQIVAGSVAPVLVQSATDDDGIVNKLFKLVFIGAVLATILVVVVVMFLVLNVWESIGGTIDDIKSFWEAANPFRGIPIAFSGLSGLLSAFAFRRS